MYLLTVQKRSVRGTGRQCSVAQELWAETTTLMGIDNSSIDGFYLSLYCDLYADIAERFGLAAKESRLEIGKIQRRVASEGLQFLTVTLPRLGKAIDTALSKGTLLTVEGFKKKPNTTTPKLFGWLISRIFTDSGAEKPEADPEALRGLRQLVYFLYKLEIPYNDSKTQKVLDSFVHTDSELLQLRIPESRITEVAKQFTASVFGTMDPHEIVPRHGPGAVATGERTCEKHRFSRIYAAIERVYPFTEYFTYGLSQVCDEYHEYDRLELLETGTAKVVLVPKDSRGPRVISCEPLEYQWIQQGLGRAIVARLEAHRLTRGFVNFTNQEINRELALEGSTSQEWVTLDMKDASDRVSNELVKSLFAYCPQLLEALQATRTTDTLLPDGREVHLNKFAPMGSCLCFPVEAFVFYALAVSTLVHCGHYSLRKARKRVYVYGDDLIVRREDYAFLLQHLPLYGLMFNEVKCCTTGFFRESCGCDAYKGVDVTPIKLRSVWGHRRRIDIGVASSYVALSNAAFKRGYSRLAERVELLMVKTMGPLPVFSHEDNGGLGFVRPDACTHIQPYPVKTRFNKALHRREVRVWQSVPSYEYADADDWSTVLRRITTPSEYTRPGTYAIPRRSRPKRGWAHLA